jgi:hypothetical protein
MYYTREQKEKYRLKSEKFNLDRQLIKLSKELTIDDWRQIRSGDYYQIRDSFFNKLTNNEIEQMYFILNRIKKYLNL